MGELKAMAYDIMVSIERLNRNLQMVTQQINSKSQQDAVAATGTGETVARNAAVKEPEKPSETTPPAEIKGADTASTEAKP